MKVEEKELLTGFFSKTLNMDSEAISGLFNTEGDLIDLTPAIDLDANRIAKARERQQQQYDRGLKEGASKIEKAIKVKYNIESEAIGVDLLDAVIESQTAELNSKLEKKMTKDDDFEKHPKYLTLKQEFEKQLKAKDTEWGTKLAEKESEWNRKETLAKVAKLAFKELETGYVLPENNDRAAALKEVMQRELESVNYSFDDDGNPVLLDKENKPLEDKHGKLIQFKDHVNLLASKYFDKKVANERENAANKNTQQQNQTGTFKSRDEFLEASKNAKTIQEQSEVYKKYQASNLD
jgi:hypothetical protein